MEKIEIEIDRISLQRAKTLAQLHKLTLPELLSVVIERLAEVQKTKDPIMGLWGDVPEIVDDIVAEAMKNRVGTPIS